jgi:acyl carrier protein
MDEQEIRATVTATLTAIAPELEGAELRPDQPLRRQVDLDSIDWLNFLIALHKELGVEIPEADYQKLTTLDAIVAYLVAYLKDKVS